MLRDELARKGRVVARPSALLRILEALPSGVCPRAGGAPACGCLRVGLRANGSRVRRREEHPSTRFVPADRLGEKIRREEAVFFEEREGSKNRSGHFGEFGIIEAFDVDEIEPRCEHLDPIALQRRGHDARAPCSADEMCGLAQVRRDYGRKIRESPRREREQTESLLGNRIGERGDSPRPHQAVAICFFEISFFGRRVTRHEHPPTSRGTSAARQLYAVPCSRPPHVKNIDV